MNRILEILEKLKEPLVTFFTGGLDRTQRDAIGRKRVHNLQVLNAFSAVAVLCIIITFYYYYLFKPHYLSVLDKVLSPLFLFLFLMLMIYLRITKNDATGVNIVILSLYFLFYAGVLLMDEEGAVYIFIFLIPFFVIFLKGSKKGIAWLVAFYIIYLIIYFLFRLYVIIPKYPVDNLDHILLGSVIASFFAYFTMNRFERNTEIIQNQLDRITEISKIDSLTGVYNKRAFLEQLEKERQRVFRQKKWLENREFDNAKNNSGKVYRQTIEEIRERFSTFSIVLIDIDFFKIFNDSYGHILGDKILKAIGNVLNSRQFLRDNDIAGRFGGEEFILLLPETDARSAFTVAERIRKEIESLKFSHGKHSDIQITLSLGIAEFYPDDRNSEEVIRRGDIAVSYAKESGRDRTVIYGPEMS